MAYLFSHTDPKLDSRVMVRSRHHMNVTPTSMRSRKLQTVQFVMTFVTDPLFKAAFAC